jgi:hypothetical protein
VRAQVREKKKQKKVLGKKKVHNRMVNFGVGFAWKWELKLKFFIAQFFPAGIFFFFFFFFRPGSCSAKKVARGENGVLLFE